MHPFEAAQWTKEILSANEIARENGHMQLKTNYFCAKLCHNFVWLTFEQRNKPSKLLSLRANDINFRICLQAVNECTRIGCRVRHWLSRRCCNRTTLNNIVVLLFDESASVAGLSRFNIICDANCWLWGTFHLSCGNSMSENHLHFSLNCFVMAAGWTMKGDCEWCACCRQIHPNCNWNSSQLFNPSSGQCIQ